MALRDPKLIDGMVFCIFQQSLKTPHFYCGGLEESHDNRGGYQSQARILEFSSKILDYDSRLSAENCGPTSRNQTVQWISAQFGVCS